MPRTGAGRTCKRMPSRKTHGVMITSMNARAGTTPLRMTSVLKAAPSYERSDRNAIAFDFEAQLELQVVNSTAGNLAAETTSETGANVIQSNHRGLPRMRFMPDGSISETSPRALEFVGRDGDAVWLALARNRLNYEIRTTQ